MPLPPLDKIAYRVDDDSDHPAGGHCAALAGESPEERRVSMVAQYATALRVLVAAAEASGDGWSLTRPMLFTVHQLCEDALSVANERHRVRVAKGAPDHDLVPRMEAALKGGTYDALAPEDRQWCQDFIALIAELTGRGFPGRFADAKLPGAQPIDDVWCCVNAPTLLEAALNFANFTVPDAYILEEPASEMTPA